MRNKTNRSANTKRASPRSQRQRGAKTAAVESSVVTADRDNAPFTGDDIPSSLDLAEHRSTTASPRYSEVNSATATAESLKQLGSSSSKVPQQRAAIKEEEEEEEEEEEGRSIPIGTEAIRTSKKRPKTAEDEDADEVHVSESTSRIPKRRKINQVAEAKATTSEVSASKRKGRKAKVKKEEAIDGNLSPPKSTRKPKAGNKEAVDVKASPTKAEQKIKVEGEERDLDEHGEPIKKVIRKRKTKEEKEADAMPIAARSNGLRMFLGAHVSSAKGVQNSVTNCVHIGGNAFAMFLKSQRKWENPPLQDEHRDLFISNCSDHKYDASSHVLPHGSYLVNLAQEEPEKAKQAYDAFQDDLKRCETLGIKLYNFHPGSTGSHPRPSAIARIAKALNRAHLATKTVTPVLETMAGGGNVVGSTFEDLRDIIALIDDKTRIGVCLDTCHVFAAGYDLRTPSALKKTLDDFDKIVGMKYLRALHINDSKAPFGSHRDLHQNIGLGFLGLRAFHNVMNESRFEGLPLVLETPIDHKDSETGKDVEDKGVWAREIKMLEGLIGVDAEGEEFRVLEKGLAERGAEERGKLQEQFDRKVEKDKKAGEKGQMKLSFGKKKKKKKGNGGSAEGSDSEA